jgi:Ca-activated chloride channel family protein
VTALFADLGAVHWMRPHWLWALALLPLLAIGWRARQRRHSAWRDAVDPHLLAHLLDAPQARASVWPWLAMLASALAIAALAGPSWHRASQPQWQDKSPLVIALDLSTATLANDLPPSRLLQARAKIAQLLRERAGGEIGLIAFADDAYTVAPLTDDVQNVAVFLDALAPDIMPVDGSRADRAIAWSARLLRQAGFRRGDILLLTDHADGDARASASSAAREGYRVSVLGMGTPTGAAYRDSDGQLHHAQLDASSLQRVTSSGDGAYAPLNADESDLRELGLLKPQQADAMAAEGSKSLAWVDDGYWLLPPLLLLGVFAFRRGRPLALLLLCLSLPWQPARAAVKDWWLRPDQQAHARIEHGAQAYRKGNYAAAQSLWRDLRDPDAAYDLGNALAKQGDYDQAIAAYDEALNLRPGMPDALANKRAVEAARRRRSMSGAGSKQSRNHQQQNGQQHQRTGQQQSGQQQNGQQQNGQQQAGQPPPLPQSQPSQQQNSQQQSSQQAQRPATAQQPQSTSAGDAARQRAADAAQRQRIQQALQQARKGEGVRDSPAIKQVTRAERERRLSDQAWLQRVPDDPGGLLRAKFRLEYERRQQGGG